MPSLETPTEAVTFTRVDFDKALLKLTKNKKCYGVDNIPLKTAKHLCQIFPDEALDMLNLICSEGLSSMWKTARILPLFKAGDGPSIKNYRPIANLCSITKIYEKMLLKKIESETHKMEGLSQHGFCANHSTLTATLEIKSVLSEALDKGKTVIAYSIDLSMAFDMLREDFLVEKIRGKISEGLLFCVRDFVQKRKILV